MHGVDDRFVYGLGLVGWGLGLAAPGHGWPMAACPRSRTGARECRAWARHRTKGAEALGYLGLFQVTRRKGETNSSRCRRNGYVPKPKPTPHQYPLITISNLALNLINLPLKRIGILLFTLRVLQIPHNHLHRFTRCIGRRDISIRWTLTIISVHHAYLH